MPDQIDQDLSAVSDELQQLLEAGAAERAAREAPTAPRLAEGVAKDAISSHGSIDAEVAALTLRVQQLTEADALAGRPYSAETGLAESQLSIATERAEFASISTEDLQASVDSSALELESLKADAKILQRQSRPLAAKAKAQEVAERLMAAEKATNEIEHRTAAADLQLHQQMRAEAAAVKSIRDADATQISRLEDSLAELKASGRDPTAATRTEIALLNAKAAALESDPTTRSGYKDLVAANIVKAEKELEVYDATLHGVVEVADPGISDEEILERYECDPEETIAAIKAGTLK